MSFRLAIASVSMLLICSQVSWAQSLPDAQAQDQSQATSAATTAAPSPDAEVESLYDQDDAKSATQKPPPEELKKADVEVSKLSDLAKLAPFSDVAVIEKRFLPKTHRFEFTTIGFTNLNNPFFSSMGVGLGLAYYIQEKYGIEALFNWESTTEREATEDLRDMRGITTGNLVGARGFLGGALKWNPIYGKMTWLNDRIVPFDMNFDLGFGMTRTTADRNEPTLHLATSQVFAWTKSIGIRWDLSWNMYQATVPNSNGILTKVSANDLFLGVGLSFYFPGATYR